MAIVINMAMYDRVIRGRKGVGPSEKEGAFLMFQIDAKIEVN